MEQVSMTESHEDLGSYSPTSLQDVTSKNLPIQCEKSFVSTIKKKETIERRCAPSSQQMGNTLMDMMTWQTGRNLMAMGIQRTNISLMAVGT